MPVAYPRSNNFAQSDKMSWNTTLKANKWGKKEVIKTVSNTFRGYMYTKTLCANFFIIAEVGIICNVAWVLNLSVIPC